MVRATPFRLFLDAGSGVPVYRQLIDQVLVGIASGALRGGDQLPTVRQVAVDLQINPNTVLRAYRELEIRGTLTTHQGTGTFVAPEPQPAEDEALRQQRLSRLAADAAARAGAEGFGVEELISRLQEVAEESRRRK
jgi:GntR family transcriptional regulator